MVSAFDDTISPAPCHTMSDEAHTGQCVSVHFNRLLHGFRPLNQLE